MLLHSFQDGWTALLGAASEGHAAIAVMLVKAKANVNDQFKVKTCVLSLLFCMVC